MIGAILLTCATSSNAQNGGVIWLGSAIPLPNVPVGFLRVTLTPACAVSAGARWRVRGASNVLSSGDLVGAFATSYTLDFIAPSGWSAPASQVVTVVAGATNSLTAAFQSIGPQSGSLVVNVSPSYAASAGARWFVAGDPRLFASGQAGTFPTGTQTVDFMALPGFTKPVPQNVTLVCGETNRVDAAYRPVGVMGISLSNGVSLSAPSGATFQVQIRPNLGGVGSWSNFATLTLSNVPRPVPNSRPTHFSNRLFRAVLVP